MQSKADRRTMPRKFFDGIPVRRYQAADIAVARQTIVPRSSVAIVSRLAHFLDWSGQDPTTSEVSGSGWEACNFRRREGLDRTPSTSILTDEGQRRNGRTTAVAEQFANTPVFVCSLTVSSMTRTRIRLLSKVCQVCYY